MNQNRIIRKLGIAENYVLQDNFYYDINSIYLISTRIDILENQNLVNKAIHEWKLMNPLLRCIIFDKDENDQLSAIEIETDSDQDHEKYFYLDEELEKQEIHENVHFLKLDSYEEFSEDSQKELWTLLANHEKFCKSYRPGKPLWSLKFLKLTNRKELNEYAVYFKINHAIADAKTSTFQILKLWEIIESIYLGKYTRPEQYKTLQSFEDTFVGKYVINDPPTKIASPRKPKLFGDFKENKPSYRFLERKGLKVLSVIKDNHEEPFVELNEINGYVTNSTQNTVTIKILMKNSKNCYLTAS